MFILLQLEGISTADLLLKKESCRRQCKICWSFYTFELTFWIVLLQSDASLIHPRVNIANGIIIGKATEWMFSKHQIKTSPFLLRKNFLDLLCQCISISLNKSQSVLVSLNDAQWFWLDGTVNRHLTHNHKVAGSQCGSFKIFLSLTFSVKSKLRILELQKTAIFRGSEFR